MIVVVTLGELIALFVFLFLIAYVLIDQFQVWNKQRKCKHESYREDRSCNAICNQCGKNLGFIGNIRDKK